jgi:hypothetical protein
MDTTDNEIEIPTSSLLEESDTTFNDGQPGSEIGDNSLLQ